ncbi:HNH endonuclease [Bacillus phage Silence]|nr:HNH endonuclease [Bacillus phage Silence]
MERWKLVEGYEDYKISSEGRVMSLKAGKERILKQFPNERGYMRINLMKKSKLKQVFVHRLVAYAFIGEVKKGYEVNHKNGDKTNNRLENLEIITSSENTLHSCYVLGGLVKAVYMLDKNDFSILKEYPSMAKASKENGIDNGAINKVCRGSRNFAGGYSWCYKKDYGEKLIQEKKERLKFKTK